MAETMVRSGILDCYCQGRRRSHRFLLPRFQMLASMRRITVVLEFRRPLRVCVVTASRRWSRRNHQGIAIPKLHNPESLASNRES